MVIGIDLSDSGSRIAYLGGQMEMPEAISQVSGREACEIPMVIARRRENEEWKIGEEAVRLCASDGVQSADRLVEKALHDDIVVLYGKEYRAVELLFNYLSLLLSMTWMIAPWQSAQRICISMGELGARAVEMLMEVTGRLDYPAGQIDFVSRSEGFYEYVMHQKEELWNHDVLLFDCMGKGVVARRMSVDRRSRPAVCRTWLDEDPELDVCDDEAFKAFCEKQAEGRIVTSVFLAGQQVTREGMPKTMRYLCLKRRVFYAHNVYSKGACHVAWDRAMGIDRRRTYLYLGKDKLRSNVGLKVNRVHEEVYVPLVDAGVNWYDVRVRNEIYLGREREIRFLISPLTGRNEHYVIVRLGKIPQRPEHATRVRISLTMESEDFLNISVEDLGFGEIFPASGEIVTESVPVSV